MLQAQPRIPQCLGRSLRARLSLLSRRPPALARLSASSLATQPLPPRRPPCLDRWPPALPQACSDSRQAASPARWLPRRRSAARGSAAQRLAPPPRRSLDRRASGRPRPSGSRPAAPRAAFPSVSPASAPCRLLVSPRPPPPRPPAGTCSVHLQAPVAPAPSHLDSLLPTLEEGSLARAALLPLARVLALGREALCSVAPQPPPRQRHPLGLAFVKLQVRIYRRFLLCCSLYYLKHLQQICISLVIKRKERKTEEALESPEGSLATGSLGHFFGLITAAPVVLLSKFSTLLATGVPVSWAEKNRCKVMANNE